MLRQHPQIFMSVVKEPRYFVSDDQLRSPLVGRPTLTEYLRLFADAAPGQVVGEASPQYLASPTAAHEIAAANPSARIIAILRDPARYVYSLHRHYVRRGLDRPADLGEALAAGPNHELWQHYVPRARYVDQLERYRAVFPPDQTHVVIYDDYRRSNGDSMRGVFRFLGVDEAVEVAPRELNTAADVRSRTAEAAWQRLVFGRGPVGAVGRAAKGATPRAVRELIRATYRRANLTSPPPVDEALMASLRAEFAPEVEKVSDYLGRDLAALWGYRDA